MENEIFEGESLFPFFQDEVSELIEETTEELPLYTEVAWNFEDNKPVIENGNFKIVTGKEAVKTWCYKALQVERYKHEIHTWDYGLEIEKYIGQNYTKALANAEIKRNIEECLTINPYVTGISDVKINVDNGLLTVNFKIDTVYGDSELEVSI